MGYGHKGHAWESIYRQVVGKIWESKHSQFDVQAWKCTNRGGEVETESLYTDELEIRLENI